MEISTQEMISQALLKAKQEPNSREGAITITKLQEALMWNNEHQKFLIDLTRRSGVGFNPNVGQGAMPQGQRPMDMSNIVLTEPITVPNGQEQT